MSKSKETFYVLVFVFLFAYYYSLRQNPIWTVVYACDIWLNHPAGRYNCTCLYNSFPLLVKWCIFAPAHPFLSLLPAGFVQPYTPGAIPDIFLWWIPHESCGPQCYPGCRAACCFQFFILCCNNTRSFVETTLILWAVQDGKRLQLCITNTYKAGGAQTTELRTEAATSTSIVSVGC